MIVSRLLVGGILGPMGTTDRIHLSTIPQVNEGYITDILTSKDATPEVKQALVKYLTVQKAPPTSPTTVKTIGAAAASGQDSPQVEPIVSRNG